MRKGQTIYFRETKDLHYEMIEPLPRPISRDDSEFKCKTPGCDGVMHQVESSKQEIKNQRCGRSYFACCTAAFFCKKCGVRAVFDLPAPECNW